MRTRTGKGAWRQAQTAVCDALARALNVGAIALPSQVEDLNVFGAFLSGPVSVCDWIGSDTNYFPYEESETDLDSYYAQALGRTHRALHGLGWLSWTPDRCQPAFECLFAFPPKVLQRAGIEVLQGPQEKPVLFLIESQTGSGKTELAQYLADWLVNLCGNAQCI